MSEQGPISDSYWVVRGRFLAGEYPGSLFEPEARDKLRQLLEAGVDLFLDLTEEGEHGLRPYHLYLEEEAGRMGRAAERRRMPIRDRGTPTPEQMTRILDAIDAALEAGRTVYLHCFGGIGRTGTVVGCYLVRHGMEGEKALMEIARMRRGTPDGWVPSPETAGQRDLVRHWRERPRS